MELSVIDRIVLLGILPESGTFLTMKIVHQLRDRLYFSEEELKEFELVEKDGRFEWKRSRAIEVPIGPKANEIIVTALKGMDAEERITDREFSLYERFVPEEGE